MNQYLFRACGTRGPEKYRDMLLHTGTEEIGHIEVLATAVAMILDGLPSEKVDDLVTNPLVSARMGGIEPRHFLSAGLAAMPSDANGVPFNANCIDVAGNLLANLRANVAAEAVGRTLAARLREMTRRPRHEGHALVLDRARHDAPAAVARRHRGARRGESSRAGSRAQRGDYQQYAYAFFGHAEEPMDPARAG